MPTASPPTPGQQWPITLPASVISAWAIPRKPDNNLRSHSRRVRITSARKRRSPNFNDHLMLYEITAGYGIIMVLVVQVIAIGLTIVFGGFKIGALKKAVQLTIAKADVNAFWGRMHQRMTELGFRQSEVEGRFLQGGAEFGNPTSF